MGRKAVHKPLLFFETKEGKRKVWYAARLCIYYGLFVFLLANCILTQTVSPLYGQVMRSNREASSLFLKHIRKLPVFEQVYIEQNNLYGGVLRDSVFNEELSRQDQVTKLERAIRMYPNSRDALYALSLIYREDGDTVKADSYLERAKQIDPLVERN